MFTCFHIETANVCWWVDLKCSIWISCLGVATLSNSAVMACQSSFFDCVPHYFSLALCLSESQSLCPNFLMGCCFREPPWLCVACGTRRGNEESCILQRVTYKLLWSLLPVTPLQERGEEWTVKITALRTFSVSLLPCRLHLASGSVISALICISGEVHRCVNAFFSRLVRYCENAPVVHPRIVTERHEQRLLSVVLYAFMMRNSWWVLFD